MRLHVPSAPVFLVREWVNEAWKGACAARRWSFLRGETTLSLAAQRAITACTVTQGSATVTSAGLFLATDAGRQFYLTGTRIYTVVSVTPPNSLTLDRTYTEPDDSDTAATIGDVYATLPADFASFRVIADPYTQRRLAYWITEDQLNVLDPARTVSDSGPRVLAAKHPSVYPSTLGRVQYEYWPRPTAVRSYPVRYNTQASVLTDTSTLTGVLADAAEVLICGALARAAEWPGTPDLKNPYFNLALADRKQREFAGLVQQLSLRDDDQAPDDLASVRWDRWPLTELAFNDTALRASDAAGGDFY